MVLILGEVRIPDFPHRRSADSLSSSFHVRNCISYNGRLVMASATGVLFFRFDLPGTVWMHWPVLEFDM